MSSDRGDDRPIFTLIARPHSVHVARWLKLFDLAGLRVRIDTADAPHPLDTQAVPIRRLAPAWLPRLPLLVYLWAGVVARWRHRQTPLLHAHCTSGSGVIAWMSGRPYIVTTYGSEIFGAANRGHLYWWMIRRVLTGAELITATTPEMAATLENEFGISPERIRQFSLSYDEDLFAPPADGEQFALKRRHGLPAEETLWVVNRRTLSLYRTREVVEGFLRYCTSHAAGRLVLLSGDDDPAYRRHVQQLIDESAWSARVRIIDGGLSSAQVAEWLKASDFAISVPQTDQLSTSILEAMACGAVPCLAQLEAYGPLTPCDAVHWVDDCTSGGFERMFAETTALPNKERAERAKRCAQFVASRFSEGRCVEHVRSLFEHTLPLVHSATRSPTGTRSDVLSDAA